ncbi:MAG: serine/threonine-protein kinase [Gemmataceae bacterium]
MAGPSVKQFLELLRQGRILDSEQLDVVTREILPKMADPRGLARELVKRGYLTAFQVNQVSQGRVKDLLVGQYLIMERLGEGGMGQVYKARHQAMGRVVALKVMRPERLANQDSINRFRREIRAAAQLSHPNVVLAYDADEVNGQHYFAMEFVEGIDLSRLVKARGPLPIKAACEYILQAAQGLKHAHERGLVHRDIKPANLLVTPLPHKGNEPVTVKILDMGLARVGEISDDSAYTQLTQDGKVVGTPDYIAPEQARDSRKADIRSDLYSLGCTLYYLLTAKVPFPGGGSVMEKLMKHQMEEPVPIETIRPEVPESLRAILKKLITKRQEDRYQTPSQLVAALEPLVTGNLLPAHAITEALPAAVPVAPAPLAMPITPDMQAGTTPLPAAIPLNQEAPTGKSALAVAGNVAWTLTRHTANALAWFTVLMVKPGPEKSRRVMRNIFAGAIGFVLVCWGIAAMFSGGDKNGNSPVDPNSPSAWLNQLDASNIPADQRLYEQP